MFVRIAKILSATLVFALLATARPADGWSLNPFASSETKATTVRKPVAKKEPSTLDKIGTGTKDFFNKTGEALGLKKPEPRKPTYAIAKPPKLQPRKKSKSNSWLPSFLQPQEPPKQKSVADWMTANKRPDLD